MEQTVFTRKRLLDYLDRIDAAGLEYLTVCMGPTSFESFFDEHTAQLTPFTGEIEDAFSDEAVLREVRRYGTGVVVFWSSHGDKRIVIPPLPLFKDGIFHGRPQTSSLKQLLLRKRVLGVLLVTWGWYAVGVFGGDALLEYKTGTGHIHKRHRKGGRSEKRFARRTEEQKKEFLRRVSNRVEEKFSGYNLEHVFFGGNRLILKPLIEECPRLRNEAQHISGRHLNVRYADRDALLGSLDEIYKSVVFRC